MAERPASESATTALNSQPDAKAAKPQSDFKVVDYHKGDETAYLLLEDGRHVAAKVPADFELRKGNTVNIESGEFTDDGEPVNPTIKKVVTS